MIPSQTSASIWQLLSALYTTGSGHDSSFADKGSPARDSVQEANYPNRGTHPGGQGLLKPKVRQNASVGWGLPTGRRCEAGLSRWPRCRNAQEAGKGSLLGHTQFRVGPRHADTGRRLKRPAGPEPLEASCTRTLSHLRLTGERGGEYKQRKQSNNIRNPKSQRQSQVQTLGQKTKLADFWFQHIPNTTHIALTTQGLRTKQLSTQTTSNAKWNTNRDFLFHGSRPLCPGLPHQGSLLVRATGPHGPAHKPCRNYPEASTSHAFFQTPGSEPNAEQSWETAWDECAPVSLRGPLVRDLLRAGVYKLPSSIWVKKTWKNSIHTRRSRFFLSKTKFKH